MNTFQKFLSLKEGNGDGFEDNRTVPGNTPGVQPNLATPQQGQQPSAPQQGELPENVSNDIKKAVERLFTVLDRHTLNKQKTSQILTSIIQGMAGDTLNAANVMKVGRNAMNPAPTPPMQPMANG
jgi:hypothetical protein